MRIHLGHHFFGAGNLGDDFMLAGFLGAMRTLASETTFTSCVPFPLEPLQQRFPEIEWRPYTTGERARAIAQCDAWVGLGGSPFQSALSSWFVDHLVGEAEACAREGRRMFFLGIGVQSESELAVSEVRNVCAGAARIWTRDQASAERIAKLPSPPPVTAAADLAHVWFRDNAPPAAAIGRVTLVANFDYAAWSGQASCLRATARLPVEERVWLAQESRELPGAERALYAALPAAEQARWRLVSPEQPGTPLRDVLGNWPSGEWLITSRYHAALAGAWAGSKIVVLGTNEKLRGAAAELGLTLIAVDADEPTMMRALNSATVARRPEAMAELALAACGELVAVIRG